MAKNKLKPKKATRLVAFHMSDAMYDAWCAAAEKAGQERSMWLRKLIEERTGVPAEVGRGMASLSPAQRAARLVTFRATIAARRAEWAATTKADFAKTKK